MLGRAKSKQPMNAFTAYLAQSRTQKILSRKPKDEGFSLIELVVVVAVLAILAAIAIPSFTSISEKARASAAANTLATIVKECATKIADAGSGQYVRPTLDGYRVAGTSGWSVAGTIQTSSPLNCATSGTYALISDDTAKYPTFTYDVGTGAKTCTASGAALTRGCPVTGGPW